MPKPTRDACGRFKKGPYQGRSKGPSQGQPKGPSQGQPKGPSQGHSDAAASEASRAPSVASFSGEADESSDNDSLISVSDADDSRSLKRVRPSGGSEGSPTSGLSEAKKPTVAADTHDFGLADAQRQLDLARRAQVQQELEERVAAKEKRASVARAKSGYGASRVLYADHSLVELERMAEEDKEVIVEVTSKSSNLKGTFQKALKSRAASMRGIVAELVQRKASDETHQMQAKIDRLQSEVSLLHQKLAEATARPQQVGTSPAAEGPASSNLEDIIRKVVMEERAFTRACIAGIEDRLLPEERLRPPLAADKRRSEPEPSSSQADKRRSEPGPSSSQAEDALLPSTTPANEWKEVARKGKGKGKGKKSATAAPVVPAPAATAPSQSQTTGKGQGKGKGKGRGKGKLVPPKTAAVVVTLTTEAAERGETYMSILMRARANADPTKLGIGSVSCRRTQAGARIFEFPGAEGSAHADLFAVKLQEVIADSAKVARPVKSAALEVTDLDDSVTKEEVVAAVAAIGGCDAAAVQGRDIRPGRGGMGTMRLECPVAAAKAVLAKGRLTVGFSSGAVRALEDQPLRCFRCFGIGHTRPLCPSTVDRTDTCYRCGKDGHKAASCEVTTPHCAVCAASGCQSDHVMKGRNCNPPPTRGKAPSPTGPAAAASTVAPAAAAESMSE